MPASTHLETAIVFGPGPARLRALLARGGTPFTELEARASALPHDGIAEDFCAVALPPKSSRGNSRST
jgi:hypothetical protein